MRELVLASNNRGKLNEFSRLLGTLQLRVHPQSDFDVPDADETGLTFVENALLKARHAATLTGMASLADDSGLEVDALNGEPGIYSARYAGRHGDDAANNQRLLEKLDGLPEQERTARFICVLVILRHAEDPRPLICEAAWEGTIGTAAQGEGGFGYDPLFQVPGYNCSAAALPSGVKDQISHRALASRKLVAALPNWLK